MNNVRTAHPLIGSSLRMSFSSTGSRIASLIAREILAADSCKPSISETGTLGGCFTRTTHRGNSSSCSGRP